MRKRVASINEAAISPGLCAYLCAMSSVYISMRTSMLMACWRGEAPRAQAWLVLFTHMRACGWGWGVHCRGGADTKYIACASSLPASQGCWRRR